MNSSTVFAGLGLLLCFLATVTLTYTSELGDATDDFPPNIRYFLNNMKNELSPEAPPHVYMNKLKRYLHESKSTAKRNGFWIWMPAQGYVPVKEDDRPSETKSTGSSGVLRYG